MLDTNVILDLIVFDDPGVAPLRAAIEAESATALTTPECLAELRRVLGYPQFRLDAAARDLAFGWFDARAQVVETPAVQPQLPRCRDPDDQKFLDLAWFHAADYLVTKDRALLVLAHRMARLGRFLVSSPTDIRVPER